MSAPFSGLAERIVLSKSLLVKVGCEEACPVVGHFSGSIGRTSVAFGLGLSVTNDGAKSISLNKSRLIGKIPVLRNPTCIFA